MVRNKPIVHVTAQPPARQPDVTGCLSSIGYVAEWNGPTSGPKAAHCFTVARFLNGCAADTSNIRYSNRPIRLLGGRPVTGSTPLAGSGYGILMKFVERQPHMCLPQLIPILHNGAVTLSVNGQKVFSGFSPTGTTPVLDSAAYGGVPCGQQVTLLYASPAGQGRDSAWLVFLPGLT